VAVDLKSVTDAAEFLSKDARAARTPDFDFIVHGGALSINEATSHIAVTKALRGPETGAVSINCKGALWLAYVALSAAKSRLDSVPVVSLPLEVRD